MHKRIYHSFGYLICIIIELYFNEMYFYYSPSANPFFNLALEEFLFENSTEDFVLIYINSDSVICGKHQTAVAESNAEFLFRNNIPLIRRFSGGGTVFHDNGNINLSFITTGKDSKVIDFRRYAESMVRFLAGLKINAQINERNDITIEGFKVSGHAAHAKNKRALHHGTLLYDSRLQRLSDGLRSNKDKFISRAVQSVRSKVTNVKPYLKNDLSINEFIEQLSHHLINEFSISGKYELSGTDKQEVENLANEKYTTYEWNYGYGPNYTFEVDFILSEKQIRLEFYVEEGIVTNIKFLQNSKFDDNWINLIGERHNWERFSKKFQISLGNKISKTILPNFF